MVYFKALQTGSAAHVAPVDKLSVVFVALFAVAFLGERLNAREWLGIALIVGGIVLLTLHPTAPPTSEATPADSGKLDNSGDPQALAPPQPTTDRNDGQS